MRAVSISVTEAARNFADCVNRVRYQDATFILHKNGVPVARLAPVEGKARNTQKLEVATSEAGVTAGQAAERAGDASPARTSHLDIW
jgi:prevent-host-death family protein